MLSYSYTIWTLVIKNLVNNWGPIISTTNNVDEDHRLDSFRDS